MEEKQRRWNTEHSHRPLFASFRREATEHLLAVRGWLPPILKNYYIASGVALFCRRKSQRTTKRKTKKDSQSFCPDVFLYDHGGNPTSLHVFAFMESDRTYNHALDTNRFREIQRKPADVHGWLLVSYF